MLTAVVLVAICILFWRAHVRYVASPNATDRRLKSQWLFAFLGAVIGSFFGVAGMGNAVIGTVPGALLGYLFAGYRMFKLQAGEPIRAPSEIAAAARDVAAGAVDVAFTAASAAKNLSRAFASWVGSAAKSLLVLAAGAGFVLMLNPQLRESLFGGEVPSGKSIQPPQPSASFAAPRPAVAASPQKSAYEVTLSELKATYPQIDPASPKFDPQILAVATRSLADLTSRGMPRDEALRQSVGLAVSLNPVRSAARQPEIMTRLVDGHRLLSANSPPEVCVYKPVMSDAEYRACGAKPP